MYAPLDGFAGPQPFNDWFTPDTVQRHQLGTMIAAVDPFWGYGEFIYGKAANALVKGSVCAWDESFNFDKVANTANTGFPVAAAMGGSMAQNSFGWFMSRGRAVLAATATVAADAALGLTGAGTVGANTAGKQLLGCRNRISQTGTKVINAQTYASKGYIDTVSGYDGWFVGAALTGTGIPASTVIARLDPDGRRVYMGSAVGTFDKVATASAVVAVTATFTGFTIAMIEAPFIQGAIT